MSQRWAHLCYLHYRYPPEVVRPLVPAELDLHLDPHEGAAWVSIVPLHMEQVHLRDLCPIPGTKAFPELNVRTYVTHDGVPGVYFLSIDATSRFACATARSAWSIPYHEARIDLSEDDTGRFSMTVERSSHPHVRFAASYRPIGQASPPEVDSLTAFLAERYAMYSVTARGRLLRGDISHLPWHVQPVEVEITENSILRTAGLPDAVPTLTGASVGSDSRCWPMCDASVPQRARPRGH